MKVTVVVDNCVPLGAKRPFLGEHGLSLLVETDSLKLLLDAGQSRAVVHNLGLLGLHPGQLDALALSHGHFDHAGGLAALLQQRREPLPVYAHPGIFQARYSLSAGGRRYIGLPAAREELDSLGARWQLHREPLELAPKLWFSGAVPRTASFETGDAKLIVADASGRDGQDPLEDDTSLYYAGRDGLVVISGCAHAGLVNTVRRGLAVTGQSRLAGWIGGTHLGPVSPEQQQQTLAALEKLDPSFIAANHCTGFAMMASLQQRFGSRFLPAFVGTTVEFH